VPGTAPRLLRRDDELAALLEALEQARVSGTLTLVRGAAGTGKSSLLAAAATGSGGALVRRARGSQLEEELPFGVVGQLLEPILRSLPELERAELFAGAAGPAARVFAGDAVTGFAGDDGGFTTLTGLYWLIAGIAARQPLALFVDDLHWSDRPSARFLAYLAARVADIPVALVVSVRTGEPSRVGGVIVALDTQPDARHIECRELDVEAVAELVRDAIPDADDTLCAAFHGSSAGNPFYLRELLRTLGSAARTVPSAHDVREAAVVSVGDRVLRRLTGLGDGAVPLAEAMTVLGMSGRLCDAAAVAELDEHNAAAVADRMRRAEILAAADPFEWIHPLVQRSLYESLSVARRDELHTRAAQALEAGSAASSRVGAHLAALRPTGSDAVVAGLLAAAEEAIARDAPEDAEAMVARALDEQAQVPSRGELLLRLGQIQVTRRDPAAIEPLRTARELLRDPGDRAIAALGLGEILVHSGGWDAAARLIDDARAELGGADGELALELDVAHALICVFDPALAASVWRDRPRLMKLTEGDSWPAHALCALLASSSAFRGEHLDEVVALVKRAVAGDVLLSQRGAGGWTPGHLMGALALVEDHDGADALADDISAAGRAQGSLASSMIAEGHRGWNAARRGDLTGAEELMRPLQDATRDNGMLLMLVTLFWYGRDLLIERPSQADMVQTLEAIEVPPAFEEAAGGGWLKTARGRVRAARGHLEGARQDLRAAGAIFDRLGFGPLHDPWRSALALTLAASERDEALALVDAELALADATRLARPRGVALRAKGLLARGDEGIGLLQEAVRVLEGSPARYEHAQAVVSLGSALRRSGRRVDAREPLAAGLESAFRCGAERLVGHAREELIATGARPRRIERTGFAALTASERRVARLAAEDRSNAEIAQALYLSVKTVEHHLSSAYAKLHIAGAGARRRLAGTLAAAEPER
jgi:DNA-binding CsgD family transcriptional regulator